jgi:hypothetical protein
MTSNEINEINEILNNYKQPLYYQERKESLVSLHNLYNKRKDSLVSIGEYGGSNISIAEYKRKESLVSIGEYEFKDNSDQKQTNIEYGSCKASIHSRDTVFSEFSINPQEKITKKEKTLFSKLKFKIMFSRKNKTL